MACAKMTILEAHLFSTSHQFRLCHCNYHHETWNQFRFFTFHIPLHHHITHECSKSIQSMNMHERDSLMVFETEYLMHLFELHIVIYLGYISCLLRVINMHRFEVFHLDSPGVFVNLV